MSCPRCHGLMVHDTFEDLRDETGMFCFKGWRCLLCGEILDPMILKNRDRRPLPMVGRARVRVPISCASTLGSPGHQEG
jgi:hypothetical protein